MTRLRLVLLALFLIGCPCDRRTHYKLIRPEDGEAVVTLQPGDSLTIPGLKHPEKLNIEEEF